MTFSKRKCLLCGEGTLSKRKGREDPLLAAWDEETISTLVSVLFHAAEGKEVVENVLRTGGYCGPCRLLLRDLSLAHKIVSNGRRQMAKVVETIVEDVTVRVEKVGKHRSGTGTLERSVRVLYNELEKQKWTKRTRKEIESMVLGSFVQADSLSALLPDFEDDASSYHQFHVIKVEGEDEYTSHDEHDLGRVSSPGDFGVSPDQSDFEDCDIDEHLELEGSESETRPKETGYIKDDTESGTTRITRKRELQESVRLQTSGTSESNAVPEDSYENEPGVKRLRLTRKSKTKGLERLCSSVASETEHTEADLLLEEVKLGTDDFIPSDHDDDYEEYTHKESRDRNTSKPRRHLAASNKISKTSKRTSIRAEFPFHCRFEGCKRRFPKEIFMEGHYKKRHLGDIRPYECAECSLKFRDHTDLARHLLTSVHKGTGGADDTIRRPVSKRTMKKFPVACRDEKCRKRFFSELHMDGHYNKVHSGIQISPYQCQICKDAENRVKGFHDYFDLKRHYRQVHQELLPDDKSDNYKCQQCNTIFGMKAELKLHISVAHEVEPEKPQGIACPVCTKLFSGEDEMDIHKRNFHEGNNPYTCEDCQKIFSSSISLRNHVKHVHPPPGRVQCSICKDKSFMSKSHLQRHEYRNHPELKGKSFKCESCDVIFANYYQMKEHRATHQEAKTYSCTQCDRVYKRLTDLHLHRKIKHVSSEVKYKCPICPKSFRTLQLLKVHEETHSGVMRVCFICGKQYKKVSHLTRHMKSAHSENTDKNPISNDIMEQSEEQSSCI